MRQRLTACSGTVAAPGDQCIARFMALGTVTSCMTGSAHLCCLRCLLSQSAPELFCSLLKAVCCRSSQVAFLECSSLLLSQRCSRLFQELSALHAQQAVTTLLQSSRSGYDSIWKMLGMAYCRYSWFGCPMQIACMIGLLDMSGDILLAQIGDAGWVGQGCMLTCAAWACC